MAVSSAYNPLPFFHAMNLQGFVQYLNAGGVICRADLLKIEGCAPFATDRKDKEMGILDRVFGNLGDNGAVFAGAANTPIAAVPNIYGPITLSFSDAVWNSVSDVVVTRDTVPKYDSCERWRENNLDPDVIKDMYWDGKLKYGDVYQLPLEVSVGQGSVSLDFCESIVVEDIVIRETSLLSVVTKLLAEHGINTALSNRAYRQSDAKALLQEQVNKVVEAHTRGDTGFSVTSSPPLMKDDRDVRRRWSQWGAHLLRGTMNCWPNGNQ